MVAIGAKLGSWSPTNGIGSGNTESIRYNRWEDRIYALRNRGNGNDDNDSDRELWYSAAGWKDATFGTLPAAAMTKANVGNVVTRPQGSSPVPNANGDMDFASEHIMIVAGVANNQTGGAENDYVMVFTKDASQTWNQRFNGTSNHWPESTLGQTTRTNEHISCNVGKSYLVAGGEYNGGTSSLIHYLLE